jgi:hypothetical protein
MGRTVEQAAAVAPSAEALSWRVLWLARAAIFRSDSAAVRRAGEAVHAELLAERDVSTARLADLAGDLERRLADAGELASAERWLAALAAQAARWNTTRRETP